MGELNSILEGLEKGVEAAVSRISLLARHVKRLESENKQLKIRLAEQKLHIEGLQKQIKEISGTSNYAEIERYKENEKMLRQKIRALLSKLDELKVLD